MDEPAIVRLDGSVARIGFPPPLLGPEPVRLAAAPAGDGLLALALPGGLLSDAHPFYPDQPSVVAGLQAQLKNGKPELERLGFETALAINLIEPEVSGVLLVGTTREGIEHWRNAWGSQRLTFLYEFVARSDPQLPDSLECALPLARRRDAPGMRVSHRSGKKSRTAFFRIAQRGELALWRATIQLPRVHQLRIHAAETGLALPGESLYAAHPPLTRAQAGQYAKRPGEVMENNPVIHLAEIRGPGLPAIQAPWPAPRERVRRWFAAAKPA